jgi:FMN phosphatase YigB (HAD superfamily)
VSGHTPGPWGLSRCVPLADAHLIAAAPELLAALKECSFRLGILVAATNDFTDVNKRALDAATSAMNKAEGR